VNDKQLLPNITRVLAALKPRRVLAFCNSLTELEATLTFLRAKKVKVDSLVSTKPNAERRTVLQQFHDGKLHALLSLEGGSRGLDYKNVDLVINVGPPPNVREYVHRAGRTARNGKPGTVVTLTVGDEQASTFMK
jgi:superfamily II DNA/RNA helicase